jgi:hypothetical protein
MAWYWWTLIIVGAGCIGAALMYLYLVISLMRQL